MIEFQVELKKLSGFYLNFREQSNGDSYVIGFDPNDKVIVWATTTYNGSNWNFSPIERTSGVRWNEDYADPNSDVARFNNHQPEDGVDQLVSYLRRLPREAPPGTRWNYSTGETNLVGVLLRAAIKKPLTQYLSEKIWVPAGMEQQATWILSKSGNEISGCCIQAATRDFARFGQFVLGGAKVGGQSVVAPEWLAEATTKRTDIGKPGRGYGFQWWTYDDGSFAARGIFGQGIFIDPKRRLVVAINADWAGGARDATADTAREAFYQAVRKAIDDEAASPSAAQ